LTNLVTTLIIACLLIGGVISTSGLLEVAQFEAVEQLLIGYGFLFGALWISVSLRDKRLIVLSMVAVLIGGITIISTVFGAPPIIRLAVVLVAIVVSSIGRTLIPRRGPVVIDRRSRSL
jgi:hypothetical protein